MLLSVARTDCAGGGGQNRFCVVHPAAVPQFVHAQLETVAAMGTVRTDGLAVIVALDGPDGLDARLVRMGVVEEAEAAAALWTPCLQQMLHEAVLAPNTAMADWCKGLQGGLIDRLRHLLPHPPPAWIGDWIRPFLNGCACTWTRAWTPPLWNNVIDVMMNVLDGTAQVTGVALGGVLTMGWTDGQELIQHCRPPPTVKQEPAVEVVVDDGVGAVAVEDAAEEKEPVHDGKEEKPIRQPRAPKKKLLHKDDDSDGGKKKEDKPIRKPRARKEKALELFLPADLPQPMPKPLPKRRGPKPTTDAGRARLQAWKDEQKRLQSSAPTAVAKSATGSGKSTKGSGSGAKEWRSVLRTFMTTHPDPEEGLSVCTLRRTRTLMELIYEWVRQLKKVRLHLEELGLIVDRTTIATEVDRVLATLRKPAAAAAPPPPLRPFGDLVPNTRTGSGTPIDLSSFRVATPMAQSPLAPFRTASPAVRGGGGGGGGAPPLKKKKRRHRGYRVVELSVKRRREKLAAERKAAAAAADEDTASEPASDDEDGKEQKVEEEEEEEEDDTFTPIQQQPRRTTLTPLPVAALPVPSMGAAAARIDAAPSKASAAHDATPSKASVASDATPSKASAASSDATPSTASTQRRIPRLQSIVPSQSLAEAQARLTVPVLLPPAPPPPPPAPVPAPPAPTRGQRGGRKRKAADGPKLSKREAAKAADERRASIEARGGMFNISNQGYHTLHALCVSHPRRGIAPVFGAPRLLKSARENTPPAALVPSSAAPEGGGYSHESVQPDDDESAVFGGERAAAYQGHQLASPLTPPTPLVTSPVLTSPSTTPK